MRLRSARDPLHTAEAKGRAAYQFGEPEESCPYEDTRTSRGAVTWSRAYRKAWLLGWRNARADAEKK